MSRTSSPAAAFFALSRLLPVLIALGTGLTLLWWLARPARAEAPVCLLCVSQAYGAGGNTGSVQPADYVELFNGSAAALDLGGWRVQYAAAGSSSWGDIAMLSGGVEPGGYRLVAAGTGLFGADFLGNRSMSATAGQVRVLDNGGNEHDLFVYGANGAPGGSSTLAVFRKEHGCMDTNSSGDLEVGTPLLRNSSNPLAPCTQSAPTDTPTPLPTETLTPLPTETPTPLPTETST